MFFNKYSVYFATQTFYLYNLVNKIDEYRKAEQYEKMAKTIGVFIYTLCNIQMLRKDDLDDSQKGIASVLEATANSWWEMHYFDPLHNAEYPNVFMTVLDAGYNFIAYTRIA